VSFTQQRVDAKKAKKQKKEKAAVKDERLIFVIQKLINELMDVEKEHSRCML
jgi:hypothetical protein